MDPWRPERQALVDLTNNPRMPGQLAEEGDGTDWYQQSSDHKEELVTPYVKKEVELPNFWYTSRGNAYLIRPATQDEGTLPS